ncbi:MAG: T9SS type A sorting domain-containing protein [Ekhidna sp.]|nr:T9SS type A sorting domain-containing protein [Ekhidna sp.]
MKRIVIIALSFLGSQFALTAQDVAVRISESETVQQIVDQLVASNSLNVATRPGNIIYEGRVHLNSISIDLIDSDIENIRLSLNLTAKTEFDIFLFSFTVSKTFTTDLLGTVQLNHIGNNEGIELIFDPVKLENISGNIPSWLSGYLTDQANGYVSDFNNFSVSSYTKLLPGNLTQYFSSTYPYLDVTDNDILVYYENKIYDDLDVKNIQVAENEQNIFLAHNTIDVAGIPSVFLAEANSEVTFHSNGSIRLLPGFHAKSGSTIHAFIQEIPNTGNPNSRKARQVSESEKELQSNDQFLEKSEINHSVDISIHPNPAQNKLFIVYKDLMRNENTIPFAVINLEGKVVFSDQLIPNVTYQLVEHGLPDGAYVIKFNAGKTIHFKRIIIQN